MNQLNSSLRANSSEYGDLMEGGEADNTNNNNPEVTSNAADHDDYELTAEEKKEVDIVPISSSADPRGKEVDDSDVNESNNHEDADNNNGAPESSSPSPAVDTTGGSNNTAVTFKFSYSPRDYEQQYYDRLFYHIASASPNSALSSATNNNKPKEEIIISPKEAAKLFYTSGVPPERLRMIWNMATLPSTPLPPGVKPPPSMTCGQFCVAVRLIQLFQNRVAAVDEQLTVADEYVGEGTTNTNNNGGGGWDRLAPAYFNGISGEIIPLPTHANSAEEASANGNNGVSTVPKMNGVRVVGGAERRRSSKSQLTSSFSSNEEKQRPMNGNNTAPPHHENTYTAQPMSMVEMEREIRRLSTLVETLQREVKALKRGNANNINSSSSTPRNNDAEDEDPTVGVEIYWGEKKAREEEEQSPSPEKRMVTPNEVPLRAKVSTSAKRNGMHVPIEDRRSSMGSRSSTRSKRLSQSQNIPAIHPPVPRRSKVNQGLSASVAATGTGSAGPVQVPVQTMKIPNEEETLTSQMHAVRRQEEFGSLLSRAKDRMDGDGGSHSHAGSKQSKASGSFRPATLNVGGRPRRNDKRPVDLSASVRHIVRDKSGNVGVYSKGEIEPPSTKAVDLAPLNPRPLSPSDINDDPVPVNQNLRRSMLRRR